MPVDPPPRPTPLIPSSLSFLLSSPLSLSLFGRFRHSDLPNLDSSDPNLGSSDPHTDALPSGAPTFAFACASPGRRRAPAPAPAEPERQRQWSCNGPRTAVEVGARSPGRWQLACCLGSRLTQHRVAPLAIAPAANPFGRRRCGPYCQRWRRC
jgi:hypothetical protein